MNLIPERWHLESLICRGAELRQAVVMRLIAVDKIFHSIGFFLAFVALVVIDSQLGGLHDFAQRTLTEISSTGRPSTGTAAHWLDKLVGLDHGELRPLIIGALAYAILEGTEAWGCGRRSCGPST